MLTNSRSTLHYCTKAHVDVVHQSRFDLDRSVKLSMVKLVMMMMFVSGYSICSRLLRWIVVNEPRNNRGRHH